MRKMFYLAEDSVSTNIMIWIRLLRQHLKCVIMSYRKSVEMFCITLSVWFMTLIDKLSRKQTEK